MLEVTLDLGCREKTCSVWWRNLMEVLKGTDWRVRYDIVASIIHYPPYDEALDEG